VRIPVITNFAEEAADPRRYVGLPQDWHVAVADVRGSTRLAEQGRHRDANYAAAACVAALRHAIEATSGTAACCQFTGDGAIAAVPPSAVEAASGALRRVAAWSAAHAKVDLRVGLVPVASLAGPVLVALHELAPGNVNGLFLGEGAAEAEVLLKAGRFTLSPESGEVPGLGALSCRWEPVQSRHGTILCLIADACGGRTHDATAVLDGLCREIAAAIDTETASPVAGGNGLNPRWLPRWRSLWLELGAVRPARRPLRALQIAGAVLLVALLSKSGRKLGGFDARAYVKAIGQRSDYRKMSGGLRMVIDVSHADADRIEAILAAHAARGTIRYGTARMANATMTCLVGDVTAGKHIHFLDGAGLGYWEASKAIKGGH